MRTAMADLVYPGRKTPEERAGALLLLEAQLAAKAPAELANGGRTSLRTTDSPRSL